MPSLPDTSTPGAPGRVGQRALLTAPNVVATIVVLLGLGAGVLLVHAQTDSITGLLDLRIYLGAARSLRDGGSIYDFTDPTFHLGSTYPPFWSLLLVPFTALDVHVLEYAWTIVNELLWLAILVVLARGWVRRDVDLPSRPAQGDWFLVKVLVVWLVTIPSAATWNTLNQGQLNIVLWLLIVVDLTWASGRRPYAGFLTGIAAALKLVPALGIVYFAVARRGRAVINGVVAIVVATGVSFVLAPADSKRYWTDLLFDTSRVGGIDGAQNNSLRSLIEHLGLSGRIEIVAWVVLAAVCFVATVPAYRRALDGHAVISAAVLMGSVSALASPISWTHHLVFLAFPLILLIDGAPRVRWTSALLLAGGALVLIDPIGFGRSTPTSIARVVLMLVIVAGGRYLVDAELRWRAGDAGAPLPSPVTS